MKPMPAGFLDVWTALADDAIARAHDRERVRELGAILAVLVLRDIDPLGSDEEEREVAFKAAVRLAEHLRSALDEHDTALVDALGPAMALAVEAS